MIRRWRNTLGRTMWESRGDPARNPRFLVIGHGRPGSSGRADDLRDEHVQYFAAHGYLERLIERGPLLSDDGEEWIGNAMLAEMPDRAALETMLSDDPLVLAGLYARLELQRWSSAAGDRPIELSIELAPSARTGPPPSGSTTSSSSSSCRGVQVGIVAKARSTAHSRKNSVGLAST